MAVSSFFRSFFFLLRHYVTVIVVFVLNLLVDDPTLDASVLDTIHAISALYQKRQLEAPSVEKKWDPEVQTETFGKKQNKVDEQFLVDGTKEEPPAICQIPLRVTKKEPPVINQFPLDVTKKEIPVINQFPLDVTTKEPHVINQFPLDMAKDPPRPPVFQGPCEKIDLKKWNAKPVMVRRHVGDKETGAGDKVSEKRVKMKRTLYGHVRQITYNDGAATYEMYHMDPYRPTCFQTDDFYGALVYRNKKNADNLY